MLTQTTDAVRFFSECVNYAHSILQLPLHQITSLFPNAPTCLLYYQENEEESKVLEIRFDEKEITLSCQFNKNGICDSSLLFLYSLEYVGELVNYLHKNFDYDFHSRSWILTKGYIRIKSMKDDLAFVCYI